VVGWGNVPDQFTIDHVHEQVFDTTPGPIFAFLHLATAHMPWQEAPDILDDADEWQDREGRRTPIFKPRTFESERAMRISRFKRNRRTEGDDDEEAVAQRADLYLENVLYDLEVIARRHLDGPDGDQIVLIMGDHQPPLIAQGTSYEVPVHVLASSPELVKGFLDAGFEDRLRPVVTDDPQVEHRELLAVVYRAIYNTP
jgi:hypothetical protein